MKHTYTRGGASKTECTFYRHLNRLQYARSTERVRLFSQNTHVTSGLKDDRKIDEETRHKTFSLCQEVDRMPVTPHESVYQPISSASVVYGRRGTDSVVHTADLYLLNRRLLRGVRQREGLFGETATTRRRRRLRCGDAVVVVVACMA